MYWHYVWVINHILFLLLDTLLRTVVNPASWPWCTFYPPARKGALLLLRVCLWQGHIFWKKVKLCDCQQRWDMASDAPANARLLKTLQVSWSHRHAETHLLGNGTSGLIQLPGACLPYWWRQQRFQLACACLWQVCRNIEASQTLRLAEQRFFGVSAQIYSLHCCLSAKENYEWWARFANWVHSTKHSTGQPVSKIVNMSLRSRKGHW